jgi:hypothetical protein
MRFGLVALGVGSVAVAAIAAACQTYDFEPVDPLALRQGERAIITEADPIKANVMLVVDKSGSMLFPVDTNNSNCPSGCGPAPATNCPAGCPTRLTEMKAAMGPFLTNQGDIARFGLAVFPLGSPCVVGGIDKDIVQSDDGIALAGAASTINGVIQAIGTGTQGSLPAAGGTPTAATLRTLENHPTLLASDRKNIVLLLTDGLPNCNSSITASNCTCVPGANCSTSTLNCLDSQASIDAVNALKSRGIQTMVVGFGADTAGGGVGFDTLNSMASAGGLPRSCTTNAECGAGDSCSNGVCAVRKFYQAANSAELAAVLQRLAIIVVVGDPCQYRLAVPPSDPSFIVVYVDSQKIGQAADTWHYDSANTSVQLDGALCDRVKSTNGLLVEVRALGTM